jgi:hypothetical protein
MKAGVIPLNPDTQSSYLPSTLAHSSIVDSEEAQWREVEGLVDMVKKYARVGTAAKAVCGMRLKILREYHFGPRRSGRPKKRNRFGEFESWGEMLMEKIGIDESTAKRWMKMGDAVERMAEIEGAGIREICEKLPWNWTPEEEAAMNATVSKLCDDKTQRQLLLEDYLPGLGYVEPERINSSNNPLGINGGKKTPAANAQERLEGIRLLARTGLFGHDSKDHRPKPGSPAFWMNSLVAKQGKVGAEAHPMASLTKHERKEIYELLIKPFVDAFRAFDTSDH